MKRLPFWSWLWLLLGILYFFLPLFATFEFSLRARRGEYSFDAYQNVLNDPQFSATFTYSVTMALATILVGVLLIVPTVFWVHLRLPRIKPLIEFITLMPFVVPAVVLVFGLLRIYSRPPLALTNNDRTTDLLLVCGYTVLSLPYMVRAGRSPSSTGGRRALRWHFSKSTTYASNSRKRLRSNCSTCRSSAANSSPSSAPPAAAKPPRCA